MKNSRYKKLPGVDHGSANDSPLNFLDNTTGNVDPRIANMVNTSGVVGKNPNVFGTPLPKTVDQTILDLQKEKEDVEATNPDMPTNVVDEIAKQNVATIKKGYYKK